MKYRWSRLLDLGLLAAEVSQVVELRATHVATGDDLDVVDHRAVHRERALDAHLEADLADGEGLAHTVAGAADDDALEDLDAGAVALGDVDVHLDGVAGAEVGDVGAQGCCVDGVEDQHDLLFLRPPQVDHVKRDVRKGVPRCHIPDRSRWQPP